MTAPMTRWDESDWRILAHCHNVDADSFYVAELLGETRDRWCVPCPVQVPCRLWAISRDETSGLWGGMTPQERYVLQTEPPPRCVLGGHVQTAASIRVGPRGHRTCRHCEARP